MFRTDKVFIFRRQLLTRSSWSSTLIVLAASQHGCTINTVDCMYSKLHTEDEQFICSKHVEDITGINLKRKCISSVHFMQKGKSNVLVGCINKILLHSQKFSSALHKIRHSRYSEKFTESFEYCEKRRN